MAFMSWEFWAIGFSCIGLNSQAKHGCPSEYPCEEVPVKLFDQVLSMEQYDTRAEMGLKPVARPPIKHMSHLLCMA